MEIRLPEWARDAWRAWGEPVNVIENGPIKKERPHGTRRDITAQLNAIAAETSPYRWKLIGKRYAIYPRDPAWDSIVKNVRLTRTERIEAARKYLEILHAQIPELADVVAPLVKGDPRDAIYVELVSLSHRASVVQHFVELLGDARDLAFVVERTRDRRRMLYFERVTR